MDILVEIFRILMIGVGTGLTSIALEASKEDLPVNAQAYLNRLEELCEVPIAIVSTGPERDETILKQHPFK